MPIELKVPEVGESITEVQIGEWLKAEGDSVAQDENILIIESEKASVELPAPAAGTLAQILTPKGQSAKVGDTVAYLEPSKKTAAQAETVEKEKTQPAGPAETQAAQPSSRPTSPEPGPKPESER